VKNILVVEDEETLLVVMAGLFKPYSDRFKVFTAKNGKEAVKILESKSIDLVITDLKMPEMDGIELLVYMNNNFPAIPAIVVSAFCTARVQKKLETLGRLRVMEKPVDIDIMSEAVIKELENPPDGSIRGISVSSFLQMIEMEQKTCALEVHSASKKKGFLYIADGDLIDAAVGELMGEEAAYDIVAWDDVQLFLKELPAEKKTKRIEKSTMAVVMEGLNRKDEASAESETPTLTMAETASQEESTVRPAVPSDDNATVTTPEDDPEESLPEDVEDTFVGELDDILKSFEDDKQIQKNRESIDTTKPDVISDDRSAVSCVDLFKTLYFQTNEKVLLKEIVNIINQMIEVKFAVHLTGLSDQPGSVQIDEVVIDTGNLFSIDKVIEFKNATLAKIMQNYLPTVASLDNLGEFGIKESLLSQANITSCLLVPLCQNDRAVSFLGLAFNAKGRSKPRSETLIWMVSAVALAYDRAYNRSTTERLKATLKDSVQNIERELGQM